MQRHFYATNDDLLPVLETVERKHKVAYTLMGGLESRKLTTVFSGAAIATLASPAPHPNASCGYAGSSGDVSSGSISQPFASIPGGEKGNRQRRSL